MEGYKGFYKTENDLIVKDSFSMKRTINEKYFLDDNVEIKYGGDSEYFNGGHGYHFCDLVSKTMPHFGFAISVDDYVVARIETFGEVVESKHERGCYATRGYKITKILSHDDLVNTIIENINDIESVNIIAGYQNCLRIVDKNRILQAYFELFKIYSYNFEENYKKIFYLYQGILLIHSGCDHKYSDCNTDTDKKEYVRKLLMTVS